MKVGPATRGPRAGSRAAVRAPTPAAGGRRSGRLLLDGPYALQPPGTISPAFPPRLLPPSDPWPSLKLVRTASPRIRDASNDDRTATRIVGPQRSATICKSRRQLGSA